MSDECDRSETCEGCDVEECERRDVVIAAAVAAQEAANFGTIEDARIELTEDSPKEEAPEPVRMNRAERRKKFFTEMPRDVRKKWQKRRG